MSFLLVLFQWPERNKIFTPTSRIGEWKPKLRICCVFELRWNYLSRLKHFPQWTHRNDPTAWCTIKCFWRQESLPKVFVHNVQAWAFRFVCMNLIWNYSNEGSVFSKFKVRNLKLSMLLTWFFKYLRFWYFLPQTWHTSSRGFSKKCVIWWALRAASPMKLKVEIIN